MNKFLCFLFFVTGVRFQAQDVDSITIRNIYNHYLSNSACYSNLQHLTKKIGGRLSGSPQAAQAVDWAKKAMYAAGADTVILQPCMVPCWVRGKKEKCELRIKGNKPLALNCTALGSSVGTGIKGITAPVVEVHSFEELDKLGEKQIRGKIVFFNVFFNPNNIRTGTSYGETVKYRGVGASHAAKFGAVACLVRSMTSVADDEPHTGNMKYDSTISKNKIPAVALSYIAADALHKAVAQNSAATVYLETHCENKPDVLSCNVVGQINGEVHPEKFIIAGGHLDSWDNGEGAHDDGAGIVQTIEMLAAIKRSGIRPRHSIRAVAFMNEENGLAGGNAYAAYAKQHNEQHIAALETDAGGYTPRGFGVDTAAGLYDLVMKHQHHFRPYFTDRIEPGGGGADLIALEKLGVPCIGFEPDTQRYFDIHHTAADTFDKINKRELELGGAAIAALVYLIDRYYQN